MKTEKKPDPGKDNRIRKSIEVPEKCGKLLRMINRQIRNPDERRGQTEMRVMKKAGVWALAGILTAASLTFAGCGTKAKQTASSQQQETSADSDLGLETTISINKKKYATEDNIKCYLILGTDHSGAEDEDEENYTGSMADFLLLAVFNKTEKTYGFLEINRDTITTVRAIDENGEEEGTFDMQICTAHWYGSNKRMSVQNTLYAVSGLLGGLQINGYYNIGMDHIKDINHAVGGVTVTIEDNFSNEDPTLVKGETIKLSDDQAYHFLHDRIDVGDGTNVNRMHRQEAYMQGLLDKLKSEMKDNPSAFSDKFRELEKYTLTNLNAEDISDMQGIIDQGKDMGILSPKGKTKTGKALDDGIKHSEFYMNQKSLIKCLTKLCNMQEAS